MDYSQEKFHIYKKEVVVAFLVWFFLGTLGGHRFYCKKPHAVTMLLLTIIGWITTLFFIGFIVILFVMIWWIIDAFKLEKWIKEYNLNLLISLQKTSNNPQSNMHNIVE